MSKKIVLNGMEIIDSVDDICTRSFFDFTEEVIDQLESKLERGEENFHISIRTEFFLNKSPKNNISVQGLTNPKTKDKVMVIMQRSACRLSGNASGTARVNLLVEDW